MQTIILDEKERGWLRIVADRDTHWSARRQWPNAIVTLIEKKLVRRQAEWFVITPLGAEVADHCC